jgi:hypothetical protein
MYTITTRTHAHIHINMMQVGDSAAAAAVQSTAEAGSLGQGQGVVFDMQLHVTSRRPSELITLLRRQFAVLPDPSRKCFLVSGDE